MSHGLIDETRKLISSLVNFALLKSCVPSSHSFEHGVTVMCKKEKKKKVIKPQPRLRVLIDLSASRSEKCCEKGHHSCITLHTTQLAQPHN